MNNKKSTLSKFDELEDIVRENTILIKKNRALVSINHDNLHNAYRESYDVTRELLLLQLERARKFIVESQNKKDVFEYLKKRIEINKKTAQVTEKIITSNEIMMEAVEDSKKVNEELVHFLETSLKEQKKISPQKMTLVLVMKKSIPFLICKKKILLIYLEITQELTIIGKSFKIK